MRASRAPGLMNINWFWLYLMAFNCCVVCFFAFWWFLICFLHMAMSILSFGTALVEDKYHGNFSICQWKKYPSQLSPKIYVFLIKRSRNGPLWELSCSELVRTHNFSEPELALMVSEVSDGIFDQKQLLKKLIFCWNFPWSPALNRICRPETQ